MRLILHAGTHKTGTSSIQSALFENRAWLRERGIFYPDPRSQLGSGCRAHHAVAHAYAGIDEKRPAAERFLADVRAEAREDETVLLSAEPIYRHAQHSATGDWWRGHTSYLQTLAAALRPFDVGVLLLFRRRDTFVESLYHERIAKGYGRPFAEWVGDAHHLLDYQRQLKSFADAFPVVDHHAYEAIATPYLLEGFFRLLGVERPPSMHA